MMAEVPLAEDRRRVSALFDKVGDRLLARAESDPGVGAQRSDDTDTLGIASCHEGGPRRAANRLGGVEIGESHTVGGEAVDVRRFDVFRSVTAEVSIPLVIGEDEDDVRRARSSAGPEANRSEQSGSEKSEKFAS